MTNLSVVMICYNEEVNLGKSLASVEWADEIVLVDAYSTDRTVEIAKQYTDRVIQNAWQGYGRQKNLGLELARSPWVLSLDADEAVSAELAREIQDLLAGGPDKAGYRIPRMTCYMGRFLRHAWYPDYKLRLFQRERARWGDEAVHEKIHLKGPAGKLRHPLFHYSFPSIRDHLQTLQRYTSLGAEERVKKGKPFSLLRLFGSPMGMFLKQYILKRGFLDGVPGLIACVLSGAHEFVKYAKQYELQKREKILS